MGKQDFFKSMLTKYSVALENNRPRNVTSFDPPPTCTAFSVTTPSYRQKGGPPGKESEAHTRRSNNKKKSERQTVEETLVFRLLKFQYNITGIENNTVWKKKKKEISSTNNSCWSNCT